MFSGGFGNRYARRRHGALCRPAASIRSGYGATKSGKHALFVLMYWFAISTGSVDNNNIIRHLATG